ncbi:family 45 glycosyl hydrolase [Bimuria novae-zelandiae CBS 107.79]|uniref:Cellulase n=1 Tax=Bimuria novae-zelandiae CBS 107.79 TaxID=1447943 RepID=A0A6A5V452_9PLEO|nr:family 45 glycosyl hydrolase [Bimuria novae-zelandiae CBS 107.79]
MKSPIPLLLPLLFATLHTTLAASGVTTRYWDCCKPSCAWPGKAQVSSPVRTCNKQDLWPQPFAPNAPSACGGGDAYTCSNNAPWAVNDNLAYGFAAAKLAGKGEWDTCCACYELTFTSPPLTNKKMVVQVTNTGGDLGTGAPNHFDLAIPGGGVGAFPEGCAKQFDGAWMGNQYGGYTARDQCYILPAGGFRDACFFRFDWFRNADNPAVEWREVGCPQAMIDRTGCGRWG